MPDEVNELLEKAGEYLSQALKVLSYSDSLYQRYRPPLPVLHPHPSRRSTRAIRNRYLPWRSTSRNCRTGRTRSRSCTCAVRCSFSFGAAAG